MEQTVIFEEKVPLRPKDLNLINSVEVREGYGPLDALLLKQLREKLEGRCSQHGYVVPDSITLLSRSMGTIENGRFTGNIVFHVQAQGRVYNPSNGTVVSGVVELKNKMGLYVIYKDAIKIQIPRELHIGDEEFDNIEKGDEIQIEIRKSRFQVNDTHITSIGIYKGHGALARIPIEDGENGEVGEDSETGRIMIETGQSASETVESEEAVSEGVRMVEESEEEAEE